MICSEYTIMFQLVIVSMNKLRHCEPALDSLPSCRELIPDQASRSAEECEVRGRIRNVGTLVTFV